MKNPKTVAKRIAEFHNDNVRRSVTKASRIEEEVIRRVEDAVEDAYERTVEESMDFNRKLFEIAHTNIIAYFELLRELLVVRLPSEVIAVSIKHWERQVAIYRLQSRELFSLAQKATIENMGPLGSTIGNALVGRFDLS
jgi:hypothetical protein